MGIRLVRIAVTLNIRIIHSPSSLLRLLSPDCFVYIVSVLVSSLFHSSGCDFIRKDLHALVDGVVLIFDVQSKNLNHISNSENPELD